MAARFPFWPWALLPAALKVTLGLRCHMALAPSSLYPTSKILTLRPGESLPERCTAQACRLGRPEVGQRLHLASKCLKSFRPPQVALQCPLNA